MLETCTPFEVIAKVKSQPLFEGFFSQPLLLERIDRKYFRTTEKGKTRFAHAHQYLTIIDSILSCTSREINENISFFKTKNDTPKEQPGKENINNNNITEKQCARLQQHPQISASPLPNKQKKLKSTTNISRDALIPQLAWWRYIDIQIDRWMQRGRETDREKVVAQQQGAAPV